ncbi:MAG: copper resistance protein CopC [Oricola sp.]|nr:MAG: copper resistance protein CopC [Oricola sp.]
MQVQYAIAIPALWRPYSVGAGRRRLVRHDRRSHANRLARQSSDRSLERAGSAPAQISFFLDLISNPGDRERRRPQSIERSLPWSHDCRPDADDGATRSVGQGRKRIPSMKKSIVALAALLLAATPALSHSEMNMTEPADGATLDAVPETIQLKFTAPARVMKVEMMHTNGAASHTKAIEIPTFAMVDAISLTPEFMGAGRYEVNWRALGEDGHVMTGSFSFTVEGE